MTRGRRSLLALLQRLPAREVAARCQVSPAAVSQWASGLKEPSAENRAMLREHCGVTWDSCPLSAGADRSR